MFKKTRLKIFVHLAPVYAGNEREGVHSYLDNMLLKYNPHINGVIIAYYNVQFVQKHAKLLYDSPFLHFHITFEALIFSPPLGSQLSGVIDKQSPSHIGLISLGFFNVTISKTKINNEEFEFHFMNDQEEEVEEEKMKGVTTKQRKRQKTLGYWMHKPSQTKLEEGATLSFSVTGFFISSGLLCFRGSLDGITPPSKQIFFSD
ncbi:hypothetical protein HMI54_015015 [Coelomomyces lativittatus]|nr:hypothetical protein HMI56_000377 [Coelomomyces lativittatus]KAJ1513424.1 hypothetical protein HMI54_015015 [Coelomomyces lativittatus]KAJ1516311.1 hypothetical protein HMI55_002541 [Coelomomyces lativittatus]